MDQAEVVEILKQYAAFLSTKLNYSGIYLFGSYANGKPKPESDIDVAVIVAYYPADILEAETLLFRACRDIDDRIEPVLLSEESDPSGFLEKIKATGIKVA